ncbi:TPA: MDR efflux pump AcrAB transcriptional activator MarA [Escherichia coli]
MSICLRKSCRKRKKRYDDVQTQYCYSKWHLQRMFKKETGHSLGQYIRSRKMTEIAQKLKESNEPILYLAERYGFESQQTLTRTFKNYFDVPPHKYRMTNMQGESRFLHPLNHYNN